MDPFGLCDCFVNLVYIVTIGLLTMKALLILLVLCFSYTMAFTQAPQAFKYQAVARNPAGDVLANQLVSFRISLIRGSVTGTVVYTEKHVKPTNAFGLVNLDIGNGTQVSGTFSAIDWGADAYFINIEMDPAGGTAFQFLGASPLLSVPYALHAKKAENGFSGNYTDLANKPSLAPVALSGNYNDLSNKPALAPVAVSGNYNDLSGKPVTDGSETKVIAGDKIMITGNGTAGTPYKIGAVENHYQGEPYGGGVVFYVDQTGQHGMICNLTDLADFNCAWSSVINVAIGTGAQSSWDGQSNTNAIINQPGHVSSAAKICDDYTNADYGTGVYSDWFLPAVDQLVKLYNARYEVNKTLYTDGNPSTYPLLKISYWSSDEGSSQYAFHVDFQVGLTTAIAKTQLNCVRAVRSF